MTGFNKFTAGTTASSAEANSNTNFALIQASTNVINHYVIGSIMGSSTSIFPASNSHYDLSWSRLISGSDSTGSSASFFDVGSVSGSASLNFWAPFVVYDDCNDSSLNESNFTSICAADSTIGSGETGGGENLNETSYAYWQAQHTTGNSGSALAYIKYDAKLAAGSNSTVFVKMGCSDDSTGHGGKGIFITNGAGTYTTVDSIGATEAEGVWRFEFLRDAGSVYVRKNETTNVGSFAISSLSNWYIGLEATNNRNATVTTQVRIYYARYLQFPGSITSKYVTFKPKNVGSNFYRTFLHPWYSTPGNTSLAGSISVDQGANWTPITFDTIANNSAGSDLSFRFSMVAGSDSNGLIVFPKMWRYSSFYGSTL